MEWWQILLIVMAAVVCLPIVFWLIVGTFLTVGAITVKVITKSREDGGK